MHIYKRGGRDSLQGVRIKERRNEVLGAAMQQVEEAPFVFDAVYLSRLIVVCYWIIRDLTYQRHSCSELN